MFGLSNDADASIEQYTVLACFLNVHVRVNIRCGVPGESGIDSSFAVTAALFSRRHSLGTLSNWGEGGRGIEREREGQREVSLQELVE